MDAGGLMRDFGVWVGRTDFRGIGVGLEVGADFRLAVDL